MFVKERKIDQENAHAEWNKAEGPTDILPPSESARFHVSLCFREGKNNEKRSLLIGLFLLSQKQSRLRKFQFRQTKTHILHIN